MNTITILVETYGKDPTATIERWHRTANQHSHKRWPPSIPKSGIIIKPISFVGQQQHPKKFEKTNGDNNHMELGQCGIQGSKLLVARGGDGIVNAPRACHVLSCI
jgi:hypothetical protein